MRLRRLRTALRRRQRCAPLLLQSLEPRLHCEGRSKVRGCSITRAALCNHACSLARSAAAAAASVAIAAAAASAFTASTASTAFAASAASAASAAACLAVARAARRRRHHHQDMLPAKPTHAARSPAAVSIRVRV